MLASGFGCSGVRTPSWSVIVPSPLRSRPRPKPEKRTVWGGTTVSTDASLRGPKAWPTGSIAIVASPRSALRSAARKRSYFERVMPGPKIATGQPPAGLAPDGTTSVKPISSEPVTFGAPLRVGVAGIARSFVSHEGERKEPNAYWPTPATAELGTSDSSTALPVSS